MGLDFCIEHAATEEGITLGDVMDHLGSASFCFVSILLATAFVQPISLGPLTMASGGVFAMVGWQMAGGKDHLILPDRVRRWHLRGRGWVGMLKFCRKLVLTLSKYTRPRLKFWVDGDRGARNVGWLIAIGGILLAVPCGNLPFNNTFPALMILFAAIAWLERDGLMAVISIGWGIMTFLYFAGAVFLVWWAGSGLFRWVKGYLF